MVIASGSHEQAGGLLLLAAATETGLLTRFEQALPPSPDPPCFPLAGSPAIRRRLLLTLLFLGAVGLQRIWDLRGYAADGLALLTGRKCKSQLSSGSYAFLLRQLFYLLAWIRLCAFNSNLQGGAIY